ncbi:MAG TPA: 2Fe-2S iron-sulfur cluster binding domain-containing protein [Streptosporangiaceae bacterium]|nr:2Fe-2S iron-sulfur cluster binding domain-containing protein [Streptosporangiaceae bacterium]
MRLTVSGDHSGDQLEFHPGETVLEVLTRHGIELPAACRAGLCGACLLRVLHGDPGPAGRAGLDDALQADGYFLACTARPGGDLTVALADAEVFAPAELLSVQPTGTGVLRVRVRPRHPLDFRAGQHMAVRAPAGIVRVYSIASLPAEARDHGIEFHVRVQPGGAMSGWLADAARGDPVGLGRPGGSCYYRPDEPDCPLLLAGTGAGLAPLAAIARDALAHGHRGPVVLLGGGPLMPMGTWPPPVRSRACLRSRGEDIVTAVAAELTGLPGAARARAYLCGAPQVVARMRRALFMAGLSLRRIHCDEFGRAAGPAVMDGPALTAGRRATGGGLVMDDLVMDD